MKIIPQAIPTNVITGFLGVGKTTAILHLLAHKPTNERWAVLVNEFGEIGIDGGLIAGNHSQENDVFIREVPGGCMCCAAGLPMQIALNRLLVSAKPDRVLIEPTGLGHPKEVIGVLTQPHYTPIIDLRATLTLIDPRKLHDVRYTEHDTFNQQIDVADVIIANKSDQCNEKDFAKLSSYLADHYGGQKPFHRVSFGEIPFALLAPRSSYNDIAQSKQTHSMLRTLSKNNNTQSQDSDILETTPLETDQYVKINNSGEGFFSVGWRFHASIVFNHHQLFTFLSGVSAQRLKGFFITEEGMFGYNVSDCRLSEFELDDALESRVECIDMDETILNALENDLLACRYPAEECNNIF
jgi:G3E family GTPase